MADGTVMNGKGEIISDAKTLSDGSIVSATGEVIGSMYLGSRFGTSIENLPEAKAEPEMVLLRDGDTYELTAGYVKKEVGNRMLRMLAYNGSVPGPVIKVEQDAEVTINFNNNTDIEQTVHSHGVRLDNAYDGTPGMTQNAVAPGLSFTYKIRFDDAGVFWYHPHVREDYAQEMGLYGNYIVEPKSSTYWSPVNREVPLVVDDILITNETIASSYKELTNFALLGRFGNEHLVNGEVGNSMKVKEGEEIRFYVTNVANTRTYNLSIPNAKVKLVGADLGKFEYEEFADSILISPAERVVVEVFFPKSGTYELTHTSPTGSIVLSTFTAEGSVLTSYRDAFETLRVNSEVKAEFEPLRKYRHAAPDKKIALTITTSGPKIDHSKHVHMQNATTTSLSTNLPNIQWDDPGQTDMTNTSKKVMWKLLDVQTRKVNEEIDDWNFKQGDLVKVQIENDPNAEHVMQHPIHFHGQRFIVLARNGVPTKNLVWKDTSLVLPGETVDILVEMTNPGVWMAHCHIAEHLSSGMMLGFTVSGKDGIVPGAEHKKLLHHAM
jgi:FtsP/CotA-like multicopper oxidase with cupredoxin domain